MRDRARNIAWLQTPVSARCFFAIPCDLNTFTATTHPWKLSDDGYREFGASPPPAGLSKPGSIYLESATGPSPEELAKQQAEREKAAALAKKQKEELEAKEAARLEQFKKDVLASAAKARQQLEKAKKNPSKDCISRESRGVIREYGQTKAESQQEVKKWGARRCGGKPAKLSNHRCDPKVDWGWCSADYVCPSTPVACSPGATKQ